MTAIGGRLRVFNGQQTYISQFRDAIRASIFPHGHESNQLVFRAGGGLKVSVVFHMRRPTSHFVGGRRGGEIREEFRGGGGVGGHIHVPDLDNMIKFVLDGMEGLVYSNDCLIYSLFGMKIYDNYGECNGRTEIEVISDTIDLTEDE